MKYAKYILSIASLVVVCLIYPQITRGIEESAQSCEKVLSTMEKTLQSENHQQVWELLSNHQQKHFGTSDRFTRKLTDLLNDTSMLEDYDTELFDLKLLSKMKVIQEKAGRDTVYLTTDLPSFSSLKILRFVREDGVWKFDQGASAEYHQLFDIPHYRLDVKLFPSEGGLDVECAMSVSSLKDNLRSLAVLLKKQFDIKSIRHQGKDLKFTHRGKYLEIELDRALMRGKEISISLTYSGRFTTADKATKESQDSIFLGEEEARAHQSSLWYPVVPTSLLAGGRYYTYNLATCEVSFTLPEDMKLVSVGRLEGFDTRKGEATYTWRSDILGAISFAAGRYVVKRVYWEDKEISIYLFPHTLVPPDTILAEVKEILSFYSSVFSEYPFPKFAICQKTSLPAYGNASYIVLPLPTSRELLAHEIAHQWWGRTIDPVGDGERWLTESFAEYSKLIYLEHLHGRKWLETTAIKGRRFLLNLMAEQDLTPIRYVSFDSEHYDNIAYHIGPWVLHMLRYVLGDEQFFEVMKTFAEKYTGKSVTVDDFEAVAESVHGQSLRWFFSQWLEQSAAPEYVLDYEIIPKEGKYLVEGSIIQKRAIFTMPIVIRIRRDEGEMKKTVWVNSERENFEFVFDSKPLEVKLDPDQDFWILRYTEDMPSYEEVQVKKRTREATLEETVELYEEFVKGYPDNFRLLYGLGRAYYKAGRMEEAAKTLKRSLSLRGENPGLRKLVARLEGYGSNAVCMLFYLTDLWIMGYSDSKRIARLDRLDDLLAEKEVDAVFQEEYGKGFRVVYEEYIAGGDTTRPFVVSTFPADGAVDVSVDIGGIRVTYSECMHSSISFSSLDKKRNAREGKLFPPIVDLNYHWTGDKKTLTWEIEKLQPNTTYAITMNENYRDLAGNRAFRYTFTFTTRK